MITLIRWYMLKAKQIKMKLALWTFAEQLLAEVAKNSDKLENRLIDALINVIHKENKGVEVNK